MIPIFANFTSNHVVTRSVFIFPNTCTSAIWSAMQTLHICSGAVLRPIWCFFFFAISGIPISGFSGRKNRENIIYQIDIMTFIHISNRLAIIGHTKSGWKKCKKSSKKCTKKSRKILSIKLLLWLLFISRTVWPNSPTELTSYTLPYPYYQG